MAKKLTKVIKDNRGQWAHPGKITQIDSNNITMKGVNYPVLGVSNTGHKQMMYPNKDYKFKGSKVTEFPMGQQGALLPLSSNQEQLTDLLLKNALLQERRQKRDSVRFSLYDQFPKKDVRVNQGMTDYYKTEPQEYQSLDVRLLDTKRKQELMDKFGKKYKYGGKKMKKAQQGFSMDDIPQQGATQIQLSPYQSQGIFDPLAGSQYSNMAPPAQQNRQGISTNNILQGITTAGAALNANKNQQTEGPSGAQRAVGQFGPWGAAISQVSQIGTGITDKSNNTTVGAIGTAVFDPAAAWTNEDLSKNDRILGGLNPLYGGYKAAKVRKEKRENKKKLDSLLLRASTSQDMDTSKRRYVRPEDQLVSPNELYPSYGTGTNYLKHGGEVPYMEQGGELQTYWGGEAEPLSENPFLPDNGEAVLFRGKSHEQGGIGMKFEGSKVEVEGGEPAVKLDDGLVVFGDMKIPSYGVTELNDPKAKNKKFKNYIKDLSKLEEKQNNIVEKGVTLVNDTPALDSFDKLRISSGKALIEGGNMKLKNIAQKKQIASSVQNAILETAEKFGLKSNELAEGRIRKDKSKKTEKAQDGYTIPRSQMAEYQQYGYQVDSDPNRMFRDLTSGATTSTASTPPPIGSDEFNRAFATARRQKLPQFTWRGKQYTTDLFKERTQTITNPGTTNRDYIYLEDDPIQQIGQQVAQNVGEQIPVENTRFGWNDALTYGNMLAPLLRPTNQRPLDPNQLTGERYALMTNQLEPVQAQKYTPLLESVSDISLQDQMNSNQADFNALTRLTANNPAAQSTLAAQKYSANSGVLGEQFRLNQAQKQGVYNRNRGVLNDATLKNLAILDQQYVRQSTAKSNTKAIAQQALTSIADKIAKNKLENRTLGIYENTYNYRYDDKGRAWNMNPLAQFQIDTGAITVDENGKVVMDETKVKRDKNGMIINSTETQRVTEKKNGGIVRAIHSL